MEQRTDEWFEARLGKVTASRIKNVMAKTKSGYSASRNNYLTELICERLTHKVEEAYTNIHIQKGIELEPIARSKYEIETGNLVEELGFIQHPKIEMSGASPDGLIEDEGLIEIKCPKASTHFNTILSNKVDTGYIYQIQWQLECTNRKWCDFVSFNESFSEHLQLKIIRIEKDEYLINEIKTELIKFLDEIDESLKKIVA